MYNKQYRRARRAPTPVGGGRKKMSERRTVALTTAGAAPSGSAPAAAIVAAVGSCSGWLSIITPTRSSLLFGGDVWSGVVVGAIRRGSEEGRGSLLGHSPLRSTLLPASRIEEEEGEAFPVSARPPGSLFFSVYSLRPFCNGRKNIVAPFFIIVRI
jgi:hypothetical protein